EEAAQPIALRPGYDMDVQVRNALADHVVRSDESALAAERSGHDGTQPLYSQEVGTHPRCWQIREGLDMLPRRHEHVPLEHRPGVKERNHLVISLHNVRGHDPGDDVAEHALADRTALQLMGARAGHCTDDNLPAWQLTVGGTCWQSADSDQRRR